MRNEGVNTQKLESVRTVVARVVVTCKPSFAAPTTRATAVIAIAAKIKSAMCHGAHRPYTAVLVPCAQPRPVGTRLVD